MPASHPKCTRSRRAVARGGSMSTAGQRFLGAMILHDGAIDPAWLRGLSVPAAAVDELTRAGWIVETTTGWRLHPRAPATAWIRRMPWSVRQELHRALAAHGRRNRATRPQAAAHYDRTGDFAEAAGVWLEVAHDAVRRNDAEDAANAVRSVLARDLGAIPPSHWEQLSRVLESSAARRAVEASLAAVVATMVAAPPPPDSVVCSAHLLPWLAGVAARHEKHLEAASLRRRAGQAFPAAERPAEAARQFTAAAMALALAQQLAAGREAGAAAVAAAQQAGDDASLVQALTAYGLVLGARGETAEGTAAMKRGLDIALRRRMTGSAAAIYHLLGTVQEYASCYGTQLTAFSRALTYCRRHDETEVEALCLGCLSYALFRAGNWSRSRVIAQGILDRPRAPALSRSIASGVLGLLAAHRGEKREAVRRLESARRLGGECGLLAMEMFVLWGLAVAEEADGGGGGWHYESLLAYWRSTDDRHDALPGFAAAVIHHARRGDLAAVREVAAAVHAIAAEVTNPEAHGTAALVTGELAWLEHDARAALPHLRQAVERFARHNLVPERSRAQLRLAAALRADGCTAEAVACFREVRESSRRLGARVWTMEAETALLELERAGHTPAAPASPSDLWSGLSPRQRDVARQLCAGASNKEVARRLGLSVRTVDMHVSHLLARLDCRSRLDAARRLGALLS